MTDEEIKRDARASAPWRASFGFCITVINLVAAAKTSFVLGRFLQRDPLSWPEVIQRSPGYLALGFVVAAICYWLPLKGFSRAVGCLKCGKTQNATGENICTCGGELVGTNYLRWVDTNKQ